MNCVERRDPLGLTVGIDRSFFDHFVEFGLRQPLCRADHIVLTVF